MPARYILQPDRLRQYYYIAAGFDTIHFIVLDHFFCLYRSDLFFTLRKAAS
jgi:hypothetical protein